MDQLDNTLTFVILCPEINISGLKLTTSSIRSRYMCDLFAMVGKQTDATYIADLSRYCPVHKGGESVTSLINAAIDIAKTDWVFVMMAGSQISENIIRKYLYFRRTNKDILYPVIDRKIPFDEASINGIMVHRDAFTQVGKFLETSADIVKTKLIWADAAITQGFQFKALVGAKLF